MPPILTVLTILWCGLVFAAFNFFPNANFDSLLNFGYVPDYYLFRSKPWGLITNAFVHVDFIHLAFNMYWLWLLGSAFERTVGPWLWMAFVLAAALVSSGFQLYSGHGGIGFSGVGYALCAYMWFTRERFPLFAQVVTQQVINLFVVWGLACIPLTYLGILNVGNVAHLSGFVFGLTCAGATILPKYRTAIYAALLSFGVVSVGSLFWNPKSLDWNARRAEAAVKTQNWDSAINHYRAILEMEPNEAWAWQGLAEIYAYRDQKSEYREAVSRLRQIDQAKAQHVIESYGSPEGEQP